MVTTLSNGLLDAGMKRPYDVLYSFDFDASFAYCIVHRNRCSCSGPYNHWSRQLQWKPMKAFIGTMFRLFGNGALLRARCTIVPKSGNLLAYEALTKIACEVQRGSLPRCSMEPLHHGQYRRVKWCGTFKSLQIWWSFSFSECAGPAYMRLFGV